MSDAFMVTLDGAAPARRFLTTDTAVDGQAVMRLAVAGEIPVGVTNAAAMADEGTFRFVVGGRPVWQVEAGAVVAPGDFVAAGAAGRAVPVAEGDPYVVAMALDAGVAPAGEVPGTVIRVAPLRTVGLGGGGGGGSTAWADITGKPSSFTPTIGATATTAVAGNDTRLTAGAAGTATVRALGTTGTTAAAGDHTHTATATTATAISPGTATTVQGILAELAARIAALEAA